MTQVDRTAQRRRREREGRRAEWIAEAWLRIKGYRLLDRRARTPHGEIDIVAMKRGVLAFVEVKARTTPESAIEAVTPANRTRIERAARLWLGRRPRFSELSWRFDIIAVSPRKLPLHLRDAWRQREDIR